MTIACACLCYTVSTKITTFYNTCIDIIASAESIYGTVPNYEITYRGVGHKWTLGRPYLLKAGSIENMLHVRSSRVKKTKNSKMS